MEGADELSEEIQTEYESLKERVEHLWGYL